MSSRVLIIDPDRTSTDALQATMAESNYDVVLEHDESRVVSALEETQPSVIIASSSAVSGDDFKLLREIRSQQPDIPLIWLTDAGSVEMALHVIQEEGAYHYFEKPVDSDKLRIVLDRAIELSEAKRENALLRRQLQERGAFGELVGASEQMRQIYSLIEQVAPSSASVLITGDSGSGKELVARTLHQKSPRKEKPFIAINCSAIPETLMESELFGHEKGAFTGAASRRQGCFELANTGTLLLDEIAEMPPLLQAKLLRVIEERQLDSNRRDHNDVRLCGDKSRPRGGPGVAACERIAVSPNVFPRSLSPLRIAGDLP